MPKAPTIDKIVVGHAARTFDWFGLPNWVVSGYFREQDGEFVLEELSIRPIGLDRDSPDSRWHRIPGRGVTSELLRRLSISTVRVALKDHMAWVQAGGGHGSVPQFRSLMPNGVPIELTSATRPRLPDEFLKEVAEVWLEEVRRGRGAYRRTLERFSRRASSEQTVKGWLVACRHRGWLAANTSPNRGRGQLQAAAGPRLLATGYRPPTAARKLSASQAKGAGRRSGKETRGK